MNREELQKQIDSEIALSKYSAIARAQKKPEAILTLFLLRQYPVFAFELDGEKYSIETGIRRSNRSGEWCKISYPSGQPAFFGLEHIQSILSGGEPSYVEISNRLDRAVSAALKDSRLDVQQNFNQMVDALRWDKNRGRKEFNRERTNQRAIEDRKNLLKDQMRDRFEAMFDERNPAYFDMELWDLFDERSWPPIRVLPKGHQDYISRVVEFARSSQSIEARIDDLPLIAAREFCAIIKRSENCNGFVRGLRKIAMASTGETAQRIHNYAIDALIIENRFAEYYEATRPKGLLGFGGLFRPFLAEYLGEDPEPSQWLGLIPSRELNYLNPTTTRNPDLFKVSFELRYQDSGNSLPSLVSCIRQSARGEWSNEWDMPRELNLGYFRKRIPFSHPLSGWDGFSREVMDSLKEIVREAENDVRRLLEMPEIGAGWASEAEMVATLRRNLPGVEIVSQGSPPFLDMQRYDAWLPEYFIAVEYQGIQHFEPVEFFGGKDGLQATKERDERKRTRSSLHGVKLFELEDMGELPQIIQEIRALIDAANNRQGDDS